MAIHLCNNPDQEFCQDHHKCTECGSKESIRYGHTLSKDCYVDMDGERLYAIHYAWWCPKHLPEEAVLDG